MPDFSIEQTLASEGLIFGLDEAGRGPWCGPVVAACVCWPSSFYGRIVRSPAVPVSSRTQTYAAGLCADAPSSSDPKTRKDSTNSIQNPKKCLMSEKDLFAPPAAVLASSRTQMYAAGLCADTSSSSEENKAQLIDLLSQINDSKKLTAKKREKLFPLIMASGALIGIGQASAAEIDEINILQASFLAMHRALEQVRAQGVTPAFALIDGNRLPRWEMPCKAIIGGDALSLSIAAASIVAKVTRDKIMAELATQFPTYGWEHNAGYGTADHIFALKEWGVTEHHRRSYAPIKAILGGD